MGNYRLSQRAFIRISLPSEKDDGPYRAELEVAAFRAALRFLINDKQSFIENDRFPIGSSAAVWTPKLINQNFIMARYLDPVPENCVRDSSLKLLPD